MSAVQQDLSTADRLACGELSVVSFGGYRYSYKLTKREWSIYEAAKQSGYMVMPRGEDSYRRMEHIWSEWCEPRGWPMIMLKPRVRYAAIEVELITVPWDRQPSAAQLSPIAHLFAEHMQGGWMCVNRTYANISRMPIEHAPFVARRVVALLWSMLGLAPLSPAEVH